MRGKRLQGNHYFTTLFCTTVLVFGTVLSTLLLIGAITLGVYITFSVAYILLLVYIIFYFIDIYILIIL